MPLYNLFNGRLIESPRRRPNRLNDEDRAQWIDNDEGLYSLWRSSRQSKRAFIRENRAFLDEAIRAVIDGTQPAHFLRYGGRGLAAVLLALGVTLGGHAARAAYHCESHGAVYSCGDYWNGGHVDSYVQIGKHHANPAPFPHVTPPGFTADDSCTDSNVYCIPSETKESQ